MLGVAGAAVALVAALAYMWLATDFFWPKLKLDSSPQGAQVTVDASIIAGKTPLTVRVEPKKKHLIDFELEGYKRARREITEGIGNFRTYTLTVELEKRATSRTFMMPVEATVYVNDAEAGRGRSVEVSAFPNDGSGRLEIRVEADGYKPFKATFGSVDEIPPSLDIPLAKAE
jgi:hypothetical protein